MFSDSVDDIREENAETDEYCPRRVYCGKVDFSGRRARINASDKLLEDRSRFPVPDLLYEEMDASSSWKKVRKKIWKHFKNGCTP
ncbi:MAG: hypothetical protein U5N86_10555 [Planctomycetota bacterium]|nr:hypothetical protein [Planctomycetota bacterium]